MRLSAIMLFGQCSSNGGLVGTLVERELTVVRRTRDVNQFNRELERRLDLRCSAKVMRCDLLEMSEKFARPILKMYHNFSCGSLAPRLVSHD